MIDINFLNFLRRKPKILTVAYSHTGNVRAVNQDNLYINGRYMKENEIDKAFFEIQTEESDINIFAVSDGMGGESYGERCSLIAVSELRKIQNRLNVNIAKWDNIVSKYINRVNDLICAMMRLYRCSSGTTLALMCTDGKYAKIYNIGDSRVYMLRKNELTQLTKDHTIVQELISSGCLSESEAKTRPDRHKLTQNLGIFPQERQIETHIHPIIELNKGDVFLLCSDGVTEMCDNSEIKEILSQQRDIIAIGNDLLKKSLEKGGQDNITIILVNINSV